MEFAEKLNSLSTKIRQQGGAIQTEEATKTGRLQVLSATRLLK